MPWISFPVEADWIARRLQQPLHEGVVVAESGRGEDENDVRLRRPRDLDQLGVCCFLPCAGCRDRRRDGAECGDVVPGQHRLVRVAQTVLAPRRRLVRDHQQPDFAGHGGVTRPTAEGKPRPRLRPACCTLRARIRPAGNRPRPTYRAITSPRPIRIWVAACTASGRPRSAYVASAATPNADSANAAWPA